MKTASTQKEAQDALDKGESIELLSGEFRLTIGGSFTPRIIIHAAAKVFLKARESSQPHVEAWGSSQPHVEAWAYAQLSLFGRVIAKCVATVAVLIDGDAQVEGGMQVRVQRATPQEWCDYYGVAVVDGVATLYKAVDEDFSTENARPKNITYAPGSIPVAPDWDGGKKECGAGLHFSPSPLHALAFNSSAKHFVACPVALADIAVHPDGSYPEKIKARGCCAPTYEVDRRGVPVEPIKAAA